MEVIYSVVGFVFVVFICVLIFIYEENNMGSNVFFCLKSNSNWLFRHSKYSG